MSLGYTFLVLMFNSMVNLTTTLTWCLIMKCSVWDISVCCLPEEKCSLLFLAFFFLKKRNWRCQQIGDFVRGLTFCKLWDCHLYLNHFASRAKPCLLLPSMAFHPSQGWCAFSRMDPLHLSKNAVQWYLMFSVVWRSLYVFTLSQLTVRKYFLILYAHLTFCNCFWLNC